MLINDLTPYIITAYSEKDSFQEFRAIYLVDDTPVADPAMVYIGDSDTIARMLINNEFGEGCVVFSAGESKKLIHAPRHQVTLVITSLSLTSLCNKVTGVFLQYEDWERMLSGESRKGIRHLLTAAARQFHMSIQLLSPKLEPSVQAIPDGEESMRMPDQAESCPQDLLNELLQHLEAEGNYRAVSTERKDGYVCALIAVHRKHTILGYLFACSTGRSGILKNMLYVIAHSAAEQMLNDGNSAPDTDSFQTLAAQFLGDQPEDLDRLEQKLRLLPNRPKRFMRGIVIRHMEEDGQLSPIYPQHLRQLYHDVQNFFPLDHVAMLEECVYVMTSDDKPEAPIIIVDNDEFETLLQRNHAFAMVSNPSSRLRGVRVLFKQCFQILPASVAIRFPEESGRRCLRFDHYSPYYIIRLCEQSASREMEVNDLLYLCHPAVLTLTRYDRIYNSNLCNTLFTFLMNDRSISETSRKLFMHRNTTIYKLNRIQELINDNLENPYTRHQLILSCMILRYAEKYQHSTFNLPPLESSLLRR